MSESAVFVADLTLVARAKDKKCPNPNVALELGYAGAQIGWPRLIGVMNSGPEYGTAKELIFDLVHKRHPFEYSVAGGADRNAVREDLAKQLAEAIKACLTEAHVQAERIVARLDKKTWDLLLAAGKAEFFSLKDEEKHQFQLIRILDMGILRFDQSAKEQKYAYHWTYLGGLVLEKLGVEKGKPTAAAAPKPAVAPKSSDDSPAASNVS